MNAPFNPPRRDPEPDRVALVVTVANFIGWHEPSDMQGGYRASEAFAAFCQLVGIDEKRLHRIIRPDEMKGEA